MTARHGVLGRSSTLSGRDERGVPLLNHDHAYYLPADEDGDGRLDHLTIFARGGFDTKERLALDRLNKIITSRERDTGYETRLLLLSVKSLDGGGPGPTAKATTWESATPYVATRYARTRGRDRRHLDSSKERTEFLIENLRTQLDQVAGRDARVVAVEPIVDDQGAFKIAGRWRPIQFKWYRRKSADDGGRRLAGAFRVCFEQPVAGPLALGHSAHFGMGLFKPIRE
jgi:CRISPR-associated protein Csb2